MMWLLAVAVFLSALAYDFAWTKCLDEVGRKRALHAAVWSVTMYAIGLVGFVGVIRESLWLAIPEIAGLFAGTYLGVRFRKLVIPKARIVRRRKK